MTPRSELPFCPRAYLAAQLQRQPEYEYIRETQTGLPRQPRSARAKGLSGARPAKPNGPFLFASSLLGFNG